GAFGLLGREQLLEAPLGQHDGAGELAVVEPDDLLDPLGDRRLAVDLLVVAVEPLELVDRRALATPPGDPPPAASRDEGELDLPGAGPVGDEALDLAAPGGTGVQGEPERFDDRRLARSGVADDGEQTEIGEVDLGGAVVGAESAEGQLLGSHQSPSAPTVADDTAESTPSRSAAPRSASPWSAPSRSDAWPSASSRASSTTSSARSRAAPP